MRDPLILRKSFMAGTKNDPRDVEAITEALRATGFLPRPAGGGPAGGVVPSEAEVGEALRAFQDREGLVVDGYAAPRGPTESERRKAGKRAAELAARPKRTGPIQFIPIGLEKDRSYVPSGAGRPHPRPWLASHKLGRAVALARR